MIDKLTSTALLACLLLGFGCKKENDVGPNTCDQIADRQAATQQTAITYAASLNRTDCKAYRAALSSYIDAAANCPAASQTDLATARANLNATRCQ